MAAITWGYKSNIGGLLPPMDYLIAICDEIKKKTGVEFIPRVEQKKGITEEVNIYFEPVQTKGTDIVALIAAVAELLKAVSSLAQTFNENSNQQFCSETYQHFMEAAKEVGVDFKITEDEYMENCEAFQKFLQDLRKKSDEIKPDLEQRMKYDPLKVIAIAIGTFLGSKA